MNTAGFLLTGILSVSASAAVADGMSLTLPHPLRDGDRVALEVRAGSIGHRSIQVSTESGELLGSISTFGVPAGKPGGVFLVPVPLNAVHGDRLDVRLSISGADGERTPTAAEVTGVRLLMAGPPGRPDSKAGHE